MKALHSVGVLIVMVVTLVEFGHLLGTQKLLILSEAPVLVRIVETHIFISNGAIG
jgi:hypothetical protein